MHSNAAESLESPSQTLMRSPGTTSRCGQRFQGPRQLTKGRPAAVVHAPKRASPGWAPAAVPRHAFGGRSTAGGCGNAPMPLRTAPTLDRGVRAVGATNRTLRSHCTTRHTEMYHPTSYRRRESGTRCPDPPHSPRSQSTPPAAVITPRPCWRPRAIFPSRGDPSTNGSTDERSPYPRPSVSAMNTPSKRKRGRACPRPSQNTRERTRPGTTRSALPTSVEPFARQRVRCSARFVWRVNT